MKEGGSMKVEKWVVAAGLSLSLGIGAIGGIAAALLLSKPGPQAFASVGIPSCGATAADDFIYGDVAIPEKETTPVNLDRVVCAGDNLHWHDQAGRAFTVQFVASPGCAIDMTTHTGAPAGPHTDSVVNLPATSSSATGVYSDCKYQIGGLGFRRLLPAHIIIMH